MKKLLLYSLFVIICFSFFSVNKYDAGVKPNQDNSHQTLSDGWVMKLVPDTEHFANVFFSTENLGCIYKGIHPVKRTTDGGNTWGYGVIPYLTTTVGGVFFNGTSIYMAGYLALPGNNYLDIIFRSSDMGQTWDTAESVVVGPPVNYYYYIHNMYKLVGYRGRNSIIEPDRTRNGGYSWQTLVASGNLVPSALSYVNVSYIYGIFTSGIGRCIYPAANFTILKSGTFSKICVVDSNNILAISSVKFFRSTNAGANWDSTVFPVNLNSISFPDQNTGYMTGSNGKIYKSTNKGANWISQYVPTSDSLVDCYFLNSQTGYVIGYNGILLKTTNGGSSASFSVSGFVRYSDNNQPVTSGKVKAFKLDKQTMNILYLDSANIQSDGSYTLINVPQDSVDIGVFPNSTPPNDWVVTYYPSTIYWEHATVIYPTGNLTNINISALRMSASSNSNSVNGKVMSLNDTPLGNLKDAILYAKNGNTFVRCSMSDAGGIYHLQSLPAGNLKIIATRLGYKRDSTTVNVTSSSNTDSINFLLSRFTVGIKKISSEIPESFKLYQNYPNPFNPKTIIKFQIKESGFVTLRVYDILGKEIATLVNEKLNAGEYEIPFSINLFSNNQKPSGIYFYKLETQGYQETKKMILIK